MKLRNKKTGEIGDIAQTGANCVIVYYPIVDGVATNPQKRATYNSIAKLNEEWEDYEEPKETALEEMIRKLESDFEKYPEEWNNLKEAEKVVEKLKAWIRLEDKGFKFTKLIGTLGDIEIDAYIPVDRTLFEDDKIDEYNAHRADLDLLFGGEE